MHHLPFIIAFLAKNIISNTEKVRINHDEIKSASDGSFDHNQAKYFWVTFSIFLQH